uniref:Uncharacterized protein n=1 Tax=Panagrolaimus superbus TaxID=310955 RepID=A0A914Y0I4_9BILA
MTTNCGGGEDPLFLKQIISRYETEEDDFLREIETMQQCANTDTSDDFAEESPVLGTLCSLVSEITDLRKQNRKLRRRLIESASLSPPSRPSRGSGVVHRVSAAFLDSRDRILPRFKNNSSALSNPTSNSRSKKQNMEIRSGARERMSSPPHKDNLTVSTYSTDLSSETFSSSHHSTHHYHHRARKPPPLVLPELSDSDAEQSVFAENSMPEYDPNSNDENCLSPCQDPQSKRNSKIFYMPSDRNSASSASATASRTSFLEFFGIRRKRENNRQTSSPAPFNGAKVTVKKRKRKISENDSVASSVHRSAQNLEKNAERQIKRQSRFFEESEDDFEGYKRKERPKSAVYLDPGEMLPKSKLKCKTKSTKSISSRDTSASEDNRSTYAMEDDFQCLKEENSLLKNEIQVLKTRNNRLIDQLREKSMQLSRLNSRTSNIEEELGIFRQKSKLNDALDKLCLKDRLSMSSQAVMETVEEKLREFDKKLQNIRIDAVEKQKATLETALREQNINQAQLEQIEQLQRENFSLLQLKANEIGAQDKIIRQKLDLMPSYDAMYSFAMGIVRKLGQLRSNLLEKTSMITQNEFEILHTQSTLLIAQAQTERLRHQAYVVNKTEKRKRPASFHGEDLLGKIVKPTLNFYLPFREYGARIERQKRCHNNNIDSLVEANEQNIETEFLRLFDYARTLSKICEETPPTREKPFNRDPIAIYHTSQGRNVASPIHSPILNDRRRFVTSAAQQQTKNVRLSALRDKDIGHVPARRPISLVEMKDQTFSGNIRKFGEEMHKFQHHDTPPTTTTNANAVKMTNCGKSGHVKTIVSSLQDVSAFHSPSTTPILGRKTSGMRSPIIQKERRLIKQSSLQHPPGNYKDEKDSHPIYDSPPKQSDSDYHSISRQMSSSAGSGNISFFTNNGLNRKASFERRISSQKRQMSATPPQISFISRLPQPSNSANSSPLTSNRNNNVVMRRNSPSTLTENAYHSRSGIRQNIVSSSPATSRSSTTSPLAPRRFMHYQQQQPNVLNSLQQVLHQYPAHHEQTIKEEDEPRSISVSEASVATTIERSSAPMSSSAASTTAQTITPNSSRLPKLSPQFERTKKAGTSWLSKLRLNHRKTTSNS